MLGMSTRTIRRKMKAGELTGYYFGHRLTRVDEAEILALIEQARKPRMAQPHPQSTTKEHQ